MDLATFRVLYPEFRTAEDPIVEGRLADAALELDADLYDTRLDEAQGYLAAHMLAVSPFGRSARMVNEDGSTTYQKRLNRVLRVSLVGF